MWAPFPFDGDKVTHRPEFVGDPRRSLLMSRHPWWSCCALGFVATASAAPATTDIGTAAPVSGYQAPLHGKWFVVCEARKDTNGDGRYLVSTKRGTGPLHLTR
jgi:hypothetical protein